MTYFMSLAVRPGDQVDLGSLFGKADNTGYSFGGHCHFGLYPCSSDGEVILHGDNGFNGALDPTPFMIPEFALRRLLTRFQEKLILLLEQLLARLHP